MLRGTVVVLLPLSATGCLQYVCCDGLPFSEIAPYALCNASWRPTSSIDDIIATCPRGAYGTDGTECLACTGAARYHTGSPDGGGQGRFVVGSFTSDIDNSYCDGCEAAAGTGHPSCTSRGDGGVKFCDVCRQAVETCAAMTCYDAVEDVEVDCEQVFKNTVPLLEYTSTNTLTRWTGWTAQCRSPVPWLAIGLGVGVGSLVSTCGLLICLLAKRSKVARQQLASGAPVQPGPLPPTNAAPTLTPTPAPTATATGSGSGQRAQRLVGWV